LTYNNFTYISAEDGSFQPFVPNPDDVPTLYLGFDRPFPNLGMTLYAWVKLPEPGQVAGAIAENPDITPAKVIWEYSNADGWRSLGAKDETGAFSDRGMIRFIGPSDFVGRSEFGKELYWLRVRWESNNIPVEPQESNFLVEPRLRQVLTNTVWAAQATTIPEEILGSSDGNPNQTFQATQTPILLNQQLSVLERAELSSAERAQVEADEGPDAIARVEDETGQLEGVWVTWHEMPDFYGSGANDRHYILDRITGEVQFGDGKYGKVPPLRRNNIRLAPYRTGGGAAGNKPAQTITELKTSVPYVESVTNREAASGGADRESIERLQERGPKALRHRDRAVTSQDIEDLAWEASPEVARAKAIGPQNDPLNMSWLPVYQFILNGPGNITVALSDFSGDGNIDVKIFGPGQSNPYLSEIVENQTANILYTVTQEQYDLSSEGEKPWSVILTNRGESIKGNISITYPGGTKNESFDAKATTEETDGRVELIIVPDKADAQPTPSLSLLELVDSYIRDRCSPSMNLVVTEPTWVEVKVTADIVPVNDDKGQEVKSDAVTALKKFLHPLTGGTTGVGWQFGRMPHESDFYAILEKVAGVDYVENLELDFKSEDDRSRNLVYSGEHQINLVSPNADD
jgi:hypothetical protein